MIRPVFLSVAGLLTCLVATVATPQQAVAAGRFELELSDGSSHDDVTLSSLDGDSLTISTEDGTMRFHIATIDELEQDGTNWWWAGGLGTMGATMIALPMSGDYEASNSGEGIALLFGIYVAAFVIGSVVAGQLTGDTTYDLRGMTLEARRKQIYDLVLKSK